MSNCKSCGNVTLGDTCRICGEPKEDCAAWQSLWETDLPADFWVNSSLGKAMDSAKYALRKVWDNGETADLDVLLKSAYDGWKYLYFKDSDTIALIEYRRK